MRSVLVGVVGAVLAVGSAEAAECRAGHMTFVSGGKAFKVGETSDVQTQVDGRAVQRSIFRGAMNGKPYVIDIQGVQGGSTAFVSYPGRRIDKDGTPPRWGSSPTSWASGSPAQIDSGPLKGDWKVICR